MIDIIEIEEVYGWLEGLGPHKLDTPAKTLIDKLENNYKSNNYIQAHQLIIYLDAIATEYKKELGENKDAGRIWTEIGLKLYQMGDLFKAKDNWEYAENAYPPASHEHAVVRGLLGAIQWKIETENVDAVKNWKGAIREFIKLADKSQKDNNLSDKEWYSEKIKEMEAALTNALTGKFP